MTSIEIGYKLILSPEQLTVLKGKEEELRNALVNWEYEEHDSMRSLTNRAIIKGKLLELQDLISEHDDNMASMIEGN